MFRLTLPAMLVLLAASSLAHAEVVVKAVEYKQGDTVLLGRLAYDDAVTGKRPGVLVVHEWWGNDDYSTSRAKQLAALGYVAFALDMYGKGKTTDDPKQAGALAGEIRTDRDLLLARFDAGMKALADAPQTDPARLAAIGYCFGGGVCLEAARAGRDLKAVVPFHGSLGTKNPARPGKITAKILNCVGGADSFVSDEDLLNFRKEMETADADYQILILAHAKHAFTNPAADSHHIPGIAYNPEADKHSWEAMKAFLAEVFAK